MVVQHNIQAMNSQRNLKLNQNKVSGNMEKLSSGYKINRSADDAAGLAISEKMRCTVTGLEQGTENAEDGIGLVRTAEGALDEIHAMLNRMKELSVQSANGTYDDGVDRNAIQKEVSALVTEVDRIVESTNFNGIPLLCREDMADILSSMVVGSEQVYLGEGWIDVEKETLSTSSPAVYTTATVGSKEFDVGIPSTYYKSETIDVPSEALSVPAGSDLPYTIEMEICIYNDASVEGTAQITTKTVSVTVDASGKITGSNGTVYYDPSNPENNSKYITDNYTEEQISNGGDPEDYRFYYVALDKDPSDPIITENEMQLIMEDLLNNLSYGVETGGELASNWHAIYDYEDQINSGKFDHITREYVNGAAVYSYNSSGTNDAGIAYSPTTPFNWENEISAKEVYTDLTDYKNGNSGGEYAFITSDYSYNAYKDGMIFGGSSTSSGRVLGVEFTVTSNGITIAKEESPSGFDCDSWNVSSDMYDQYELGTILGVTSVPEPYRTEVGIPTPYPTIDEILDASINDPDSLKDYLIQVMNKNVESNKDEEDVTERNSYVIVTQDDPVDAARQAQVEAIFNALIQEMKLEDDPAYGTFIEDNMTVIWNDSTEDLEHYAIEDLCDVIASDMGITATRELDDPNDVSIDDNVTNKYIIELGQYTQSLRTWTTTIEQEWGDIYATEEWYEYEYADNAGPIILQVGDQNEEFDRVAIVIKNMRTDVQDLLQVDASTQTAAAKSIDIINDTINSVSSVRADLGAYDNRLQHTINKNRLTTENLQEAESKIRDTDMAEEMMEYTKNNILIQSAQSMLAHAMSQPEGVLQLLG